jgi:streptogramin lyase
LDIQEEAMKRTKQRSPAAVVGLVICALAGSVLAQAQSANPLLGGVRGTMRTVKGYLPEGMMVQLVSHKNSIRTTVFTNRAGRYEFPKLEAGWYTLRIARPLEYKPYQRDSVWIEGAATLDEIVLDRVTDSEFLPPTPEIMAQMSDAEWLNNLPGTVYEKTIFSHACGSGCHTWQQSLRNRFDEHGWTLLVNRMMTYATRLLIQPRTGRNEEDSPVGFGMTEEEKNVIIQFLARVRGPNSEWALMRAFPRPIGRATRAIITEYEFPRFDQRPHDVVGDAQGNIWFDSNRNPLIGKLDPKTGAVTEYKVPITPGKHTGQHWIDIGKDGKIVMTESWSNNLVLFDPKTAEFVKRPGMGGNKGLAPDGFIWGTCGGGFVCKFDPATAKPVERYPMKRSRGTYGNAVSPDGKYFGGGTPWQPDFDGLVFFDIEKKEVYEVETPSGASDPSRAGFDPDGNLWTGGRGGRISVFDRQTKQVRDYVPPTPYVTFYEAKPDKNGEVWAGAQRGGRIVRLNPKTDEWVEYQFPEPISLDWRTWVDNSTSPVNVWYGEHNGYLVHIQPLD